MRIGFNEEQLRVIVENHPLAYEAFRKFYYKTKGMETILGKISPDANPEEVKRSMEMFVKLTLSDNFRDLYDFFDSNSIYCCLLTHTRIDPIGLGATIIDKHNEGTQFYNSEGDAIEFAKEMNLNVKLIEVPADDEGVTHRVKVERHMFIKAFEILNERL